MSRYDGFGGDGRYFNDKILAFDLDDDGDGDGGLIIIGDGNDASNIQVMVQLGFYLGRAVFVILKGMS